MLSTIFAGVLFLLCAFASMKDMASLTIPNWVNAGIALTFIPAAITAYIVGDVGLAAIGWHILTGLVVFIICFALFAVGAFGGGDAKMIPAIALWMGPAGMMPFLFGTTVAGGILALSVLMARKSIPEAFAPGFVRATMQDGNGVPYGVAITVGAIVGGFSSPFVTNFLSLFSSLN